MNHGSVFTGIGGFDLSAERMGWKNIFHCELNEYRRKHIERHWPNAKSHNNIETTDFTVYRGTIDVLTGGFPCQDASNAMQVGQGQRGLDGERTGLFFHMLRAIDECRPRYVVAENVANILKVNKGRDFFTILNRLAALGYNAEWRVCYASEVGAPHRRSRVYLVAYPNSIRIQRDQSFFTLLHKAPTPVVRTLTGTNVEVNVNNEWLCESPVYNVDDGVPDQLARAIESGGNAVVPQISYRIFKTIEQFETLNK